MAVFRWKDKAGLDVFLKFDAVTTVETTQETDITEHPVEKGPDVSDHIRARLPQISVAAYISNTPLYSNPGVEKLASFQPVQLPMPPPRKPSVLDVATSPGATLGSAVRDAFSESPKSVTVLVWTDLRSRVREAIELLKEAQEGGFLVSVTDDSGDLDDLVISRRSAIRALEDGDGATIQLEARQIRLTSVAEVDAPEPAEVRGQVPKALGNQATTDDPNEAAKKTKLKSLTAMMVDAGADALGLGG